MISSLLIIDSFMFKGQSFASNDDAQQTEDLLRNLNVRNLDRRKKSFDERDRSSPSINRLNFAKPSVLKGEQTGSKSKK